MVEPIVFDFKVFMNSRDITKWCTAVSWGQPTRYLEKEFSITTAAWHMFQPNARYDIFAAYESGLETYEMDCVVRQGWILPDQKKEIDVVRGEVPEITINGKSWSSASFRRAPKDTLVVIPREGDYASNLNYARTVLRDYGGTVGKFRVLSGCQRLDQLVIKLAWMAQFSASWSAPWYPMQPMIIPPDRSYWEAILDLIEPFALEVEYYEHWNGLNFIDPIHRTYWRANMDLPGNLITNIRAVPVGRSKIRRVIVKVPPWH